MSLVNMEEMLKKAQKEGYAVGNFDVFNQEMARGVMDAAVETKSPVILAYAEAFDPLFPLPLFAAYARKLAELAPVPVALHLDHARDMEFIRRALGEGFTSIMIDASDKEFGENVEITKTVGELCKKHGASLEAELGHVGGTAGQFAPDEHEEGSYTDVDEAKRFIEQTGADALAVAIGTVHGAYKGEPKLNLERLQEIRAAIGTPLVLHGGSGLSGQDMKACIKNGITKLNIFTDLTFAALDEVNKGADPAKGYLAKCEEIMQAVGRVSKGCMEVFGCVGKA